MQNIIEQLYKKIIDPIQNYANKSGVEIMASAHYLDFIRQEKIIRLHVKHFIYGMDVINSYDYYFGAVDYQNFNGFHLVDYSTGRYHDVVGFEIMPIYFPSLAEPVITTNQYMDFASLSKGNVVLDLGAYSGLTSIIFKEAVGNSGVVVSVDADCQNIEAINKNLNLYKKISGNDIDLLYGAVWNHCNGLSFSSEGNMGSSAAEIVGIRGNEVRVKSYTLDEISKIFDLNRLDFIKCDVEGAENVIFEGGEFFKKYRPRIIIETHLVNGIETTEKCIKDLGCHGYSCRRIEQKGVTLPLVECYP